MSVRIIETIKKKLRGHERVVVKGTGIALAGIVSYNISSFILLLAKTRLMPASDLGMLVLATSIVIMCFVLTNGFSGAVFRYATLFRGEGDKEKVKGVVVTAYVCGVPLFLAVFILVMLFAGYIAGGLFKRPELAVIIRIMSVMALAQAVTGLNVSLLISKYLVKYKYIFRAGSQVLAIGLVLLMFLTGSRNMLVVFASALAAAAIVMMVYSFFLVKREFSFVLDRKIKARQHRKKLFIYAFIVQATDLLIMFRLEVNVFIMAFFLATSDIALYKVALQMGMVGGILLESLNDIFPAVVGTLYGQNRIAEIRKMHLRTAGILLCVSILIFLVFLLFGKYILWIFGGFYREAFVPLIIIAFSFIVESGVGSAGRILTMMGKPHYNTFNTFVALVVTTVLCYLLVPVWGVVGAAAAFAASNITNRLLMFGEVLWLYGVKAKVERPAEEWL